MLIFLGFSFVTVEYQETNTIFDLILYPSMDAALDTAALMTSNAVVLVSDIFFAQSCDDHHHTRPCPSFDTVSPTSAPLTRAPNYMSTYLTAANVAVYCIRFDISSINSRTDRGTKLSQTDSCRELMSLHTIPAHP